LSAGSLAFGLILGNSEQSEQMKKRPSVRADHMYVLKMLAFRKEKSGEHRVIRNQ
jgi:hypothetical protein